MKSPPNSRFLTPKEGRLAHNAVFPGPEAFIPLKELSDNFGLLAEPKMGRKLECYRVQVDSATSNCFMENYHWRVKTSLPIVRTVYTNILSEQGNTVQIQVFNEHCPHRLEEFNDIPLNQAFYLMKEALYGFERLWQKFGEFQPEANMIAINQNLKCRVWINRNFSLNLRGRPFYTEEEFIRKVFEIFECRTVKTQTSKMFFKEAVECQGFLKAFKLINTVISQQKIKVPSKFTLPLVESRKRVSRSPLEVMKGSGTSKFFRSANYTREILNKKSQKNLNNHTTANSAYIPYKQRKDSANITELEKDSIGTTLSQTLMPNRKIRVKKPSTPTARTTKDPNSPQPAMRSKNSYMVKRSLFRSSSIDAQFLNGPSLSKEIVPEEEEDIVKEFPNISKGRLTESHELTPDQLEKFQKTAINKKSTMEEDYDSVTLDIEPILLKNGWERKLGSLLGQDTLVRQSIVQGKQQRADSSYVRLMKLDAMGVNVVASILPDDVYT